MISPEPRQQIRRKLFRWSVVLLLVGALAWIAFFFLDREYTGHDNQDSHTDSSLISSVFANQTRIQGQVYLEGEEELSLIAPPSELGCHALVWHQGVHYGAPARCDEKGQFSLALEEFPGEEVHVEILVPGYLRGIFPISLQQGEEHTLPPVALGKASSVRGQVVNIFGQPITDVALELMPSPHLNEPEPWRVQSDAKGSFVVDTLPPGLIHVRAQKPRYAISEVDVFAPESQMLIVLEQFHELHGQVVGDADVLRRVRVRLEGSSLWPPITKAVDGGGHFVFEQIVDGIYGLEAVAEAEAPGQQDYASWPLENVSPDMRVSLALIPAFRVPVQVMDDLGQPVANARIVLSNQSVALLARTAISDTQGQAKMSPVVPGFYLLQADADGFLPSPVQLFKVEDGKEPELQILSLKKPGTIRGLVVDEQDRPVAGAMIVVDSEQAYQQNLGLIRAGTFGRLQQGGSLGVLRGEIPAIPLGPSSGGIEQTEASFGQVESDQDGRFELTMLPPGTYQLRAHHGRYAASARVQVKVKSGQQVDGVILKLRQGFSLTGRVLDTNRQPIAGVQVELTEGFIVETDERGVFDAGLHRGRQEVTLRAAGMIPQQFSVQLTRASIDIERIMEPATGQLSGRVRDGNLQPIPFVRVLVVPQNKLCPSESIWTDERGLFAWSELCPGPAVIELEHQDYAPASQRVHIPEDTAGTPLELSLAQGWQLDLLIRADGSGEGIAQATVRIADQRWHSDEEGWVHLRNLANNKISLHIAAEGWVPQTREIEHARDGSQEQVVELVQGGGLEGFVQDERGEVLPEATIIVRSSDKDEVLAEVSSDSTGFWSISGLPEGKVKIHAKPPVSYSSLLAPAELTSDVRAGYVTREVNVRFDRL